MNYYYDLKLNFQKNNCFFYEWDLNDEFTYIKKIPCFYISIAAMEDILANKIKILDNINERKVLLIDKNCAITLLLDKDGIEQARSYLDLADELKIIGENREQKITNLKYITLNKIDYDGELRQEKIIKGIIINEINRIEEEKNYQKLQYLYMEWFNEISNDWDKMIKRIREKLNESITDLEIKIYEIIKLSYKKI